MGQTISIVLVKASHDYKQMVLSEITAGLPRENPAHHQGRASW